MNVVRRLYMLLAMLLPIVMPEGAAGDDLPQKTDSRQKAPLLVAHRGLLKHAPENTLASFAACLELRLGFELDIRRTKDGHLVCLHDDDVRRTTNGTGKVG